MRMRFKYTATRRCALVAWTIFVVPPLLVIMCAHAAFIEGVQLVTSYPEDFGRVWNKKGSEWR